MYQPEIGRFFTQDRFSEKYYDLTPYQYGANNPIKYIDINGDSLGLNEIDPGAIDQFKGIVQSGSGGYWLANVDPQSGLVTLEENQYIEGSMTEDQAKFVGQLSNVINGPGLATINVANNSEQVVIGDIVNRTMDVGDMAKLGTDGKVTAQKTLIHEVVENYAVQGPNPVNVVTAHMRAGNAENRIGGAILSPLGRTITQSVSNPNVSTLQVPVLGPAQQAGTVRIHLYKNNVMGVMGNSMKPIFSPIIRR